jgi:hypothetical protein
MPYIIDGHNLIPKVPGLSLSAVDDEMQLIEQLQEFCRLQRKAAEVFFDNAPPGFPTSQRFGLVTVRFVRRGTSADAAIRNHLYRLGKNAHNWTVVSSDMEVRSAARAVRATTITSEEFAHSLVETSRLAGEGEPERPDASLTPEELEEWLDIFRRKPR